MMVLKSFNLIFKILIILSKHNILNMNMHNVTPTYSYERQKYTLIDFEHKSKLYYRNLKVFKSCHH